MKEFYSILHIHLGREKKEKLYRRKLKTFNFVISSKLNYLFWKGSNFHNKKEKKETQILSP